ncbi:MAG TPA: hypothetical protein VL966_14555 [Alphaproteobacteria bacterium]|jgi:hypothetical protein|nr:hypothetical protein [Alphaproteobacteria bacterium]
MRAFEVQSVAERVSDLQARRSLLDLAARYNAMADLLDLGIEPPAIWDVGPGKPVTADGEPATDALPDSEADPPPDSSS